MRDTKKQDTAASAGASVADWEDPLAAEKGAQALPRREISIEVFDPETWDQVKHDVVELEERCFNKGALAPAEREYVEEWRRRIFSDPDNMVIVARNDEGRLVGFCYAHCSEGDTAQRKASAVHPEFQGKGIIADLATRLDSELRDMGYEYATISAVKDNGFAEKVVRSYGRRIVDYDEDSIHANLKYKL